MNKKIKVILLIFTILIGTWAYFFWKFRDIGDSSVASLYVQNDQEDTSSEKGPYSQKFQEKLFYELKGKEKLPKFEDFPATVFSDNKNIIVDVNSDPIGKIFPTAIRYSVKYNGISFAGKYSTAEWGCGTGCQNGAIVDADTGHIYPIPGLMVSGFEVRKDSRLLIQNPLLMKGGWREWYPIIYWEWAGNKLKLISVYKVDFVKKEIIETGQDDAFNWIN
ncbi:MAG: hypothetical protein A2817_00670 [Candidatus Yanofskybacteria bacterium RIFCSPHIGHO2_01_FULL_39_8b]|uniref:Uncharacterized protein n=1 Tax=Candidatus Yanofskybacteria bacterium RIFCSPHIGHO2_01_FULL_39_8b TaxID=1802659 RepID=A0A1F8E9C4_9BACT|nr:MAG: hypothetical protein A2817_00670 [Candidatus Yanofskybacteria bacterium RIFCSPHIGHO2_01_FULL_39_8b]